MVKIEESVFVNRPVTEVWKFMSNVENGPKWDRGVLAARVTSEGALGIGSRIEIRRQFFGRQRVGRLQISEWEAAKTVEFKINVGQATATQRYTFDSFENGTKLTQTAELDFIGWWKLISPLLLRMLKRDGREDLANIKRILENMSLELPTQ
jgi:hypothetical protein